MEQKVKKREPLYCAYCGQLSWFEPIGEDDDEMYVCTICDTEQTKLYSQFKRKL